MSKDRLIGRNPNLGRNYSLDYLTAACALLPLIEAYPDKYKENPNYDTLEDFLYQHYKAHPGVISLDKVRFDRKISSIKFRIEGGTFGIVHARQTASALELKSKDGEVLVGPKKPFVEINFPSITSTPEVTHPPISALLLRRSFSALAEYLATYQNLPPTILGLTHSRMGKIGQRWGFELSEKPFPSEVYQMMNDAEARPEVFPDYEMDALQKFIKQVLVYQPTEKFIESFSDPNHQELQDSRQGSNQILTGVPS